MLKSLTFGLSTAVAVVGLAATVVPLLLHTSTLIGLLLSGALCILGILAAISSARDGQNLQESQERLDHILWTMLPEGQAYMALHQDPTPHEGPMISQTAANQATLDEPCYDASSAS
jgi:hypothetical protein